MSDNPPSVVPPWFNKTEGESSGVIGNPDAPQMISRPPRAPPRKQKMLYLQPIYHKAFNKLVFEQKEMGGSSGAELGEEALDLLFKKYNEVKERLDDGPGSKQNLQTS